MKTLLLIAVAMFACVGCHRSGGIAGRVTDSGPSEVYASPIDGVAHVTVDGADEIVVVLPDDLTAVAVYASTPETRSARVYTYSAKGPRVEVEGLQAIGYVRFIEIVVGAAS